jgi:hypothetical protein
VERQGKEGVTGCACVLSNTRCDGDESETQRPGGSPTVGEPWIGDGAFGLGPCGWARHAGGGVAI